MTYSLLSVSKPPKLDFVDIVMVSGDLVLSAYVTKLTDDTLTYIASDEVGTDCQNPVTILLEEAAAIVGTEINVGYHRKNEKVA